MFQKDLFGGRIPQSPVMFTAFRKVSKQGIATVEMQFQTTGTDEIRGVMSKLQQIPGVFDVTRM